MTYKNFKEFYWKFALLRIGIPWGFIAGILFAIAQDKAVFKYFTSFETLLQILFFIIGGFLYAWLKGRSLWNRYNKTNGI